MLGKLLKYDFREAGRLLLPILAGILIISLFGRLMLATNLYFALPDILQFMSVAMYVLLIFVCSIGAPIYFIVYFYRDFYTDKGYIIHTLPVTTNQKLISKIITSYVLELLTFAVCILSVFILIYEEGDMAVLSRGILSANTQFRAMMDMDLTTFLLLTLILMLISMLSQLLTFYASISIGQVFGGHRILGSIVGYMGLSFVSQIASSVILFVVGFGGMDFTAEPTAMTIYAVYGLSGCLNLLLGLGCYMISYYFMEKKLNLN